MQFHPWSQLLQRVSHNAFRFVKPYNVTLIFFVPVFVFAYCWKSIFYVMFLKLIRIYCVDVKMIIFYDILAIEAIFFAQTRYLIKHYRAKRPGRRDEEDEEPERQQWDK